MGVMERSVFASSTLAPPDRAFQLDVRFGYGSLGGGGGINLGARLAGRVQVGVGLSAFHQMYTTGDPQIPGGVSNTRVTFTPGVAVDVWKALEDRVALVLRLGLPVGVSIAHPFGGVVGTSVDQPHVGFDAAVGMRFAVVRYFALGLEAGCGGLFELSGGDEVGRSINVYGNLVGTFFIGK
jgi:hypothetical protein